VARHLEWRWLSDVQGARNRKKPLNMTKFPSRTSALLPRQELDDEHSHDCTMLRTCMSTAVRRPGWDTPRVTLSLSRKQTQAKPGGHNPLQFFKTIFFANRR
ncbi:unnamed protein product, partial [Pylaiella littoralis]